MKILKDDLNFPLSLIIRGAELAAGHARIFKTLSSQCVILIDCMMRLFSRRISSQSGLDQSL